MAKRPEKRPDPLTQVKNAQDAARTLLDKELPGEWVDKLQQAGFLMKNQTKPQTETIVTFENALGKIIFLIGELKKFAKSPQGEIHDIGLWLDLPETLLDAIMRAASGTPLSKMPPLVQKSVSPGSMDMNVYGLVSAADVMENALQQPGMSERLDAYVAQLASDTPFIEKLHNSSREAEIAEAEMFGFGDEVRRRHAQASLRGEHALRQDETLQPRYDDANRQLSEKLAQGRGDDIRHSPAMLRAAAEMIHAYSSEFETILTAIDRQRPQSDRSPGTG